MSDVFDTLKPIEIWASRYVPLLGSFGAALSFAVLFGGTALAAYSSDFTDVPFALLCGTAAIWFVKLYVGLVPAMQRLIDRLLPEPDAGATSDQIPGWAVVIYMGVGAALLLAVIATEQRYSYAVMELFLGWVIGRNTLHYLWMRRM